LSNAVKDLWEASDTEFSSRVLLEGVFWTLCVIREAWQGDDEYLMSGTVTGFGGETFGTAVGQLPHVLLNAPATGAMMALIGPLAIGE
jgi:hypothetical protein